jgi:hypothetical protein
MFAMRVQSLGAVVVPIVAGLFAAAADALYLYVIWAVQEGDTGNGSEAGVWFIAGSIGAAAVFLLVSSVVPSRSVRAAGLVASAVGLAGFAVIGAFSIGIFLLPAVFLAFLASSRALAVLPRPTASIGQWTGVLVGLTFPGVFLVALAP